MFRRSSSNPSKSDVDSQSTTSANVPLINPNHAETEIDTDGSQNDLIPPPVHVPDSRKSTPIMRNVLLLLLSGITLGLVMPKNNDLPTPSIRIISSCIGYTYFLSWSVSFYPQVLLNFSRKTTTGFSTDFAVLNVVGFSCYAIYSGFFFWNKTVQKEYRDRHNDEDVDPDSSSGSAVESNDVAFAFHAVILSCVQFGQILYYDFSAEREPRRLCQCISRQLSPWTVIFLAGATIVCIVDAILVYLGIHGLLLIDYLYMLSSIKLAITIIKYIPQVRLNYERKSTVGWNVWNVLLDFTGGSLSLLQLVLDAVVMNDFSAITGNWVKFGLSFVSIFFDIIFMMQHYILYPDQSISTTLEGEYENIPAEEHSSGFDEVGCPV